MNRTRYPASGRAGPAADPTVGIENMREIVSFESYPEAEAAVDALADEGFPVENLSIAADGLRYFENITGRRSAGDAAFDGLATGAVTGALIGFILGLFEVVEPLVSGLVLALWGVVIGGVVGAILGAASVWLSRGRRNFASVAGVQAARYVVLCDPEVATQAVRLLGSAVRRQ